MSQLGPEAGLISALFNYATQNINNMTPPASNAMCALGDLLCEVSNGNYALPTMMSSIIATAEATTGINRYYSGPVALLFVGAYFYRKYNAKTAFDLILNTIKTEFGDKSVALEIFNGFKKAIEEAADKQVEEFISKYKTTNSGMDQKAKDNARNKFTEELIKGFMPNLLQNLRANKNTLETQAKDVADSVINDMANVSVLPAIPGAQNAPAQLLQVAAKKELSRFIRENIVSPKGATVVLKNK